MTFHVGQQVVCVDAAWTSLVEKGSVYTVEGIKSDCLVLIGVAVGRPYSLRGMFKTRFRPVAKTDISIFTAMLNPAPHRENIDA